VNKIIGQINGFLQLYKEDIQNLLYSRHRKYSKNYRPSEEMPVVTTLHPVATKHAEQSCTGLHHPYHHPKIPLWGFGKFSAFSSFSAHRYDRNIF